MKKMVSILMIIVMLMFAFVVPSVATSTDTEYFFVDRFVEEYYGYQTYKEVYYHYDANNEMDWCLIYAQVSLFAFGSTQFLKFDDFILVANQLIPPIDMQYVVYDVKKDCFVDLVDDYDDLFDYNGLIDVLRNLEKSYNIGDTDRDKEITIIDAHIMQSILAKKTYYLHYPGNTIRDVRDVNANFYDVDADEEFSILDATAIQLKLAELE